MGFAGNKIAVASNQKIIEVLILYRESLVRNRRNFYTNEIKQLRYELSEVNAELSFQPFISKYVIE